MKQMGKVKKYNGNYGIIETKYGSVDFSKNDLSFDENLTEGSLVEFRVENKCGFLKLARNIILVKKK